MYIYIIYIVPFWVYTYIYIKKMETANFRLFGAGGNGKRKFVFLGRQTINGKRCLLYQQTCLSMSKKCYVYTYTYTYT